MCELYMCLLVEETALTPRKVPPPIFSSPFWSLATTGCPSVTIARCQPDHWREDTKQSVCACAGKKWKKHTFWLKEEVRLKEWLSGRERALMMLKIGPWLRYTPQVNHHYSLLSTYLSPCPPIIAPPTPKRGLPPPHPGSTSFTTTYSKLPSS